MIRPVLFKNLLGSSLIPCGQLGYHLPTERMSSASSSRGPTFCKPKFFDRFGSEGWFCNVCTPFHSNHLRPMSGQAAMAHEQNSNGHARNVSDFEMWNPEPTDSWVMPEDDTPLTVDELKARTRQVHVDQVRDMVPFWMKGVEAAQKGEVLRLEDFLEKLASEDRWGVADVDDPWGPSIGPWPADHPWAAAVPGGPADPWGKAADNPWGKVDDDPWGKVVDWAVDEDSTLSICVGRSVSHHREDRKRNTTGGKGKGRKKQNRDHEKRSRPDPHLFVEDIARQQAVNAERKRRMHDFYEMPTQDKVKKIEEMVRYLRTVHV